MPFSFVKSETGQLIRFFFKGRLSLICGLAFMMSIYGLLEIASLASLLPFVQAGIEQEKITADPSTYQKVYTNLAKNLNLSFLAIASIVLLCLTVMTQVTRFILTLYSTRAFARINTAYKNTIFHTLTLVPFVYFTEEKSSKALHSIVIGADSIGTFYDAVIKLIAELFKLVFMIILLYYCSAKMLLVMLITIFPAAMVIRFVIKKMIHISSIKYKDCRENEIKIVSEFLQGIKTIRAFDRQNFWQSKYAQVCNAEIPLIVKIYLGYITPSISIQLLLGLGVGMTGLYMSNMTSEHLKAFIPMLTLFVISANKLNGCVTGILQYYGSLLQAGPNLMSIQNFLTKYHHHYRAPEKSSSAERATPESLNKPDVPLFHFEGVTFGYTTTPIIKNLNLKIYAGQTIAIVGSSGSGKSTLFNLMLRNYKPDQGQITLNQKNINSYDHESYSRWVTYVDQEPFVFDASIRDNIAFGGVYSDEEIYNAAKNAGLEEFILKLPGQMNTPVGEKGNLLSGGQKQRISIARAFLSHAAIILLDEPTSALDNESEGLIQETLKKMKGKKTFIIIAHRLSTIAGVDRIYVLEQGSIQEAGTHQELLQAQGKYFQYYNMGASKNHVEI